MQALSEAYNGRAFDDAVRFMHPAVELYPALTDLDVDTVYRGRDGIRRFMETITAAWDSYVAEPEEMIEISSDQVLVVERWCARGHQGIQFEIGLIDVYTFRDGLIVRIDGFRDRREALEAVGLRE